MGHAPTIPILNFKTTKELIIAVSIQNHWSSFARAEYMANLPWQNSGMIHCETIFIRCASVTDASERIGHICAATWIIKGKRIYHYFPTRYFVSISLGDVFARLFNFKGCDNGFNSIYKDLVFPPWRAASNSIARLQCGLGLNKFSCEGVCMSLFTYKCYNMGGSSGFPKQHSLENYLQESLWK